MLVGPKLAWDTRTGVALVSALVACVLCLRVLGGLLFPLRALPGFEARTLTIASQDQLLELTSYDAHVVASIQHALSLSSPLHVASGMAAIAGAGQPSATPPLAGGWATQYKLLFRDTEKDVRLEVLFQPPGAWPLRLGTVTANSRTTPVSPGFLEELYPLLQRLHETNAADLVTWDLADGLFPRFAVAELIDVQTGARFFVQRRAGTNHADIQPLTANDTRSMKRAFGGEWSWERRPVLVRVGGRVLAGSMNGMPHGAGRIHANDFPGHSCLYFVGSKTHASSHVDLQHLLAVLLAAGIRVEHPEK